MTTTLLFFASVAGALLIAWLAFVAWISWHLTKPFEEE